MGQVPDAEFNCLPEPNTLISSKQTCQGSVACEKRLVILFSSLSVAANLQYPQPLTDDFALPSPSHADVPSSNTISPTNDQSYYDEGYSLKNA